MNTLTGLIFALMACVVIPLAPQSSR